jgi:hypothetical protein
MKPMLDYIRIFIKLTQNGSRTITVEYLIPFPDQLS